MRSQALAVRAYFEPLLLGVGTPLGSEAVLTPLDFIHSEGPALGLVLNLSKCTVWWPTPNNAELARYNSDIQRVSLGGVKFLGSALSSAEFADDMLKTQKEKLLLKY
jgi:hypothetical protein